MKFHLVCTICGEKIFSDVTFEELLAKIPIEHSHEVRKHWWAENSNSMSDDHIG